MAINKGMGETRLILRYLHSHPERLGRLMNLPGKENNLMLLALKELEEVEPCLESLKIHYTELDMPYWNAVFISNLTPPCSEENFYYMLNTLENIIGCI